MTDRKAELATMCAVEIRRTVTLAMMSLADYGYHLAMPVFDAEFQAMLDRCSDKPFDEHDFPALMELVMEDLWPRLRTAHADLRGHIWRHVVETKSTTVAEDAVFAMDTGWAPLVNEAADRVATYPTAWAASIVGGKEKLGCLVLHVASDFDQRGARSEIERLREEVRLRSLATCDICGQQGRLRLSSIAKTVCDTHSAVLGEMREDDGMHADPWRWHEEQPVMDHIDDIVTKARAVMAAAKAADTSSKSGRERELLIAFGDRVQDVVAGAVVKEEYLDDYISAEIDGWRTTAVVLVSEKDRDFLHGYLREQILAEYDRVKRK
ncbi:hypothetical protein [Rhizobium sp.]|uniref:hypothetical protein n=1 Tax=Rhizobium sp. TaxID=391 RepID=UPI0028ACA852